jgi:hypothetical protein
MVKKYQNIKVVKIPLKRSLNDMPQVFPRMPRLYLELIENKDKIKQDLINKEYVPEASPTFHSHTESNLNFVEDTPNTRYNENNINNIDTNRNISPSNTDITDNIENNRQNGKDFETRLERLLSEDSDNSNSPDVSSNSSVSELSIKENEVKDNSSDSSDDLSIRLRELLNEDSNSEASFDKLERSIDKNYKKTTTDDYNIKNDKYSKNRDKNGHSIPYYTKAQTTVPTLAELEKRGGYVPRVELRDIHQTSMNEQQEEDYKREILFKFDLLRKSYPMANIPSYTIHTDLQSMQRSYDESVRRLSLDSSVENYKTYLVYGFMGCEFIFGNFLGFDMQGFTQQQITSMNSYEKLLIELGEKSYVPTGKKWPVELRLLFMIIMNAAFFVISKMIMKKTGANLMGMINNMNSSRVPSVSTQPKRRMRGPNIDLGDIPDIESDDIGV